MKSEARVQSEIIKYIKSHGGWVIKTIRVNENGCPDLLACIAGQFYGIEVKAEKFSKDPYKQASPYQKKQLESIENAGGVSICAATLEQALEIIEFPKEV